MPTELYENLQAPKRAVLAAVDTGAYDVEISLAELRELAKTAGYPVVGEAADPRCRYLYGQRPPAGTEGLYGRGGRGADHF